MTENQTDDILTVHAQFVICTRFTALLTFYIKKCTRCQSIRRAKFFRVSYYSLGRMTLRRHKKKQTLKKVFTSPKSRRRRLVNTSFYYLFSIPKQSDQQSKVRKDASLECIFIKNKVSVFELTFASLIAHSVHARSKQILLKKI